MHHAMVGTIHQREDAMFAANLIRTIFMVMLLCSASAFAQRVTIAKDINLREEPRFDSVAHSSVQQGAIGEILAKTDPWFRVNVNENKGWVLTTDIRFSNLPAPQQSVRGTATMRFINCFPDPALFASDVSEKQLALLDSYAVPAQHAARPHEPPPAIAPSRE